MSTYFEKVKQYLQNLEIPITKEIPKEELVIVSDEENGIKNLMIDCEDPLLIFEQVILKVPRNPGNLFERLLKMNRNLVHGAFVLDEEGKTIFFRDTLQLENLDQNELEGTIKALSLALFENMDELIAFSKK
jgi:hypothetical protein